MIRKSPGSKHLRSTSPPDPGSIPPRQCNFLPNRRNRRRRTARPYIPGRCHKACHLGQSDRHMCHSMDRMFLPRAGTLPANRRRPAPRVDIRHPHSFPDQCIDRNRRTTLHPASPRWCKFRSNKTLASTDRRDLDSRLRCSNSRSARNRPNRHPGCTHIRNRKNSTNHRGTYPSSTNRHRSPRHWNSIHHLASIARADRGCQHSTRLSMPNNIPRRSGPRPIGIGSADRYTPGAPHRLFPA